jgi:hypothetical protein
MIGMIVVYISSKGASPETSQHYQSFQNPTSPFLHMFFLVQDAEMISRTIFGKVMAQNVPI